MGGIGMNVEQLLDRLRRHGVVVSVSGGQIRLVPGSRVPGNLVAQLQDNKSAVRDYIFAQSAHSAPKTWPDCWPLELWRRTSLPEWRENLSESVKSGDKSNEEYARWMLREILLDPQYREHT